MLNKTFVLMFALGLGFVTLSSCGGGGQDGGVSGVVIHPPKPGVDPGVDRSQVGPEFGTLSTTERRFDLTCTNTVFFKNAGNVVLPSVDLVALPRTPGTVTIQYDAYDIPDRFVLQVGSRVIMDTQYVGDPSYTVTQVNDVLTRYNFRPTSQARINSPGDGTRSFQVTGLEGRAIVRVYAPLEGTEWEISMSFSGSSCGGGGGQPGIAASVEVSVEDACNDGYRIDYRYFAYSGNQRTGSWPGPNQRYHTKYYNKVVSHSLTCGSGTTRICLEAQQGNYSWGVGINDERGCNGCCYSCPSTGTNTYETYRFGCN